MDRKDILVVFLKLLAGLVLQGKGCIYSMKVPEVRRKQCAAGHLMGSIPNVLFTQPLTMALSQSRQYKDEFKI